MKTLRIPECPDNAQSITRISPSYHPKKRSCKRPKTYQDLIFNEWNTDLSVELDENGEVIIPAFYGDYNITTGQKEVQISLKKEEGSTEVNLN